MAANADKGAKTTPETPSELLRARLIAILRSLTIIIPILALCYVGWWLVMKGDPRKELKTPDATLTAYTNFVAPFMGPSPGRPNQKVIDDWLSFFDNDSRKFFNDYAEVMAFARYQFEEEEFKALSKAARREQAMLYVCARPPLSGIGAILETRAIPNSRVSLQVRGVATQHRIIMEQRGDLWYLTELGGLMVPMRTELDNLKRVMPR